MREELDIPMPRMAPAAAPSYRVALSASRMDAATKRLAIIAAAIGGALLLLVGVWSLSGHHGGVPVVEAESRPLRTKPDQPGGMQVAGENETILSGVTGGKDAMAPPPEVPAPQALKAEADQQLAVKAAAAAVPDPVALTPPATLPDAAAEPAAPAAVAAPEQQPVAHPAMAKAVAPVAAGAARRPASGGAARRPWRQDLLPSAHRRLHRHRPGHRVLRAGAGEGGRLRACPLLTRLTMGCGRRSSASAA